MASQGACFGLCLGLVLLQSGCGAYEQAQQAAQNDRKLRTDYLVQKTEQLETMQQLGLWYLQFQRQNAKSPADLSELLDSVSNPTAPRTAKSIATLRRLTGSGEIVIDWSIDLAAWQVSGQDLSKCRIAWTAKTEVYNVYLDGVGKVHDVLTADFAVVKRMTGAPKPATLATRPAVAARPGEPIPSAAGGGSIQPAARRPLTSDSSPAEFVAALESGQQVQIIPALGLLVESPKAVPDNRVSRAILGVMKTANPVLQINGVLALEKWGTAAVVSELEALSEKSNNFGLQIQVQRIEPILKSRQ